MVDKNQTGLFPEASQDITGNSNDSEQNLQLLKLDSSSQKVPEATHELANGATDKNQQFTEGKLGLPFNYAVFIVFICTQISAAEEYQDCK